MRKFWLLILVFKVSALFGQGYNHTTLDCNGLRIMTGNTGGLIDAVGYEGGLEQIPKEEQSSYVRSILSTYINVAGKINGKISGIFVNKYSPLNQFEEYQNLPGPFETKSKYYKAYDKFWRVKKWEIQALKDDYEFDFKLDKEPSVNILTWPARGNKYAKQIENINWPDRTLAPFFDRNYDGKYDPYDGDYPLIDHNCPENIPSEMVWSIFHSAKFKLEIQMLTYGFESEINPIINKTIFTKVRFLNAGPILVEPRLGLYFDFDLGCTSDDYLGTSPSKNTIYAYNKNEFEPIDCYDEGVNVKTFSGATPTQSITCLNRKSSGSMIYDRDNTTSSNDPTSPEKYYNYLNNKWNNGQNLTFGSNGNVPSNVKTDHIFPSSPSDPNGWSMMTAGIEMTDPRGFLNFSFPNIPFEDHFTLDFATTLHEPDLDVNHFKRVDKMLENIDVIKSFYNNCYDSKDLDLLCKGDCVWPGDVDNNGIVNNLDLLTIWPQLNAAGSKRHKLSNTWSPNKSIDWYESTDNDINLKYLDCNGNGIISEKDISILKENLMSSNYKYKNWGGYNIKGNQLTFGEIIDSLSPEDRFEVDMNLAEDEAISLSGLGYTVEYDSTSLELINVVVEKKWLDNKMTDNILILENGKVHISLINKHGNEVSAHNVHLGVLKFKVKKEISGTNYSYLKYSNYEKVDSKGKKSALSATGKQFIVSNPFKELEESFDGIMLYPNPTNGLVHVRSKIAYTRGEMCNLMGVSKSININNNSFLISNDTPGIYTVKLYNESGEKDYARLVVIK